MMRVGMVGPSAFLGKNTMTYCVIVRLAAGSLTVYRALTTISSSPGSPVPFRLNQMEGPSWILEPSPQWPTHAPLPESLFPAPHAIRRGRLVAGERQAPGIAETDDRQIRRNLDRSFRTRARVVPSSCIELDRPVLPVRDHELVMGVIDKHSVRHIVRGDHPLGHCVAVG